MKNNDLKTVETINGPFNIINHDQVVSESLKLYGEWAQNEILLLSDFISPDDVIVDIGGYIGTHAVSFSKLVPNGKVLSFEARKAIFDILCANTDGLNNVETFNLGLGSKKETIYINRHNLNEDINFGGLSLNQVGNSDLRESISLDKLDNFEINKVNFIKIDVEGMEYEVLIGANNIIKNNKPVIFLEVNDVEHSVKIIEWAKLNHYKIFGVNTKAYNENNYHKNSDNIFGDASETGFLLVHDESSQYKLDKLNELCPILTMDDVVLLMLSKRQYPYEILANQKSAQVLSLQYHSPKIDALEYDLAKKLAYIETLEHQRDNTQAELENCILERDKYRLELERYNSVFYLLRKLRDKIVDKVK